jgi:aspartate ammonia-lyase
LGHAFWGVPEDSSQSCTTISEDIECLDHLKRLLMEVNLGGTAVGTGINTPKGYAAAAVTHLANISGLELMAASDLIEASSDLGAFVTFSGVLKRVAVKLSKICDDLRLLSSGPRASIGEIVLPPVQAGSSIMTGKVNPVVPEVVNQVAFQAVGNDLTVTLASEAGQLQLNAFEPIIIFKVLESMRMLTRSTSALTDRCVGDIKADEARCEALLSNCLVYATALAPKIGYEKAALIAKTAHARALTIREAAAEIGGFTEAEIDDAFRPEIVLGHFRG